MTQPNSAATIAGIEVYIAMYRQGSKPASETIMAILGLCAESQVAIAAEHIALVQETNPSANGHGHDARSAHRRPEVALTPTQAR